MSGVQPFAVARQRKELDIKEKVRKGARWMPWLTEAMKDVISCDKPWVGANDL